MKDSNPFFGCQYFVCSCCTRAVCTSGSGSHIVQRTDKEGVMAASTQLNKQMCNNGFNCRNLSKINVQNHPNKCIRMPRDVLGQANPFIMCSI